MSKQRLISILETRFKGREFTLASVLLHARTDELVSWREGFAELEGRGGIRKVGKLVPRERGYIYELTGKKMITESAYQEVGHDYRGVWTTERDDYKCWPKIRSQYMGKRTLMADGALHVEGVSLIILWDGEQQRAI